MKMAGPDNEDQRNTDQVGHSNETRTDKETPLTSTIMPFIRPPPPSMLASLPTNNETPQAPLFYPVDVEATLVRESEITRAAAAAPPSIGSRD